ncbi:hypothetical protein [Pseudomonas sp. NGC7]|uniref:hypothetical protein n=1 Tax=Pseudomonas sp. NGC7 TaxID=3341775 RepID=UPI0037DACBF4
MSLTLAILMLVGMWLSVAAAMLWGVLRIVRRHSHNHLPPQGVAEPQAVRGARRQVEAH